MTGNQNIEGATVEHGELSFHKHLDAFNAQAYEIFATNLKKAKPTTRYQIKWRKGSSIIMLLTTIFLWNHSYTTFKIYGMIAMCIGVHFVWTLLIRIKYEFA